MKTARIKMAVVWLVFASQTMADNFTIANVSIQPGETKTISVELNNAENENFIAFEFYLSLPEGVSVLEDEDGYLLAELNSSRCTEDHELMASKLKDGTYRFLCFSLSNASLNGTSGEILTITITASETAEVRVGKGTLLGQILSISLDEGRNLNDTSFNVCIGQPEGYCPHGYLLGDINYDEKITVTDVMQVVNFVINQVPSSEQGLCPQGCLLGDLNTDKKITVTDVMQMVGVIINH